MRAQVLPLAVVLVLLLTTVPTLHAALAAEGTTRYAVEGTVVSDRGVPVEGASVSAYVSTGSSSWNDQTTTDKAGSFSLLLPAGQGSIHVYYPEWRASDGQALTIKDNVTGLRFVLATPPPKTAVVSGRVLGADGAPLTGATVQLNTVCCVYAYDGGAVPPGAPDTPASSDANASSASGGSGTASSGVVSKPIAPPNYYDYPDPVVTGSDGAFTFTTYAGEHQLVATAKGYAQGTQRVTLLENRTVTADVRLEKVPAADAIVTGKVVDATTGLPVAGAQVSLYNAEWGRSNWTQTAADGTFHAQQIPGWTQITVTADGNGVPVPVDAMPIKRPEPGAGAAYYTYAHVQTLASGANELAIKLQPKPAHSVVLTGYVVDAKGQVGVPKAYVNVWNQDAGEWGNAQTDATGSYKILVRPGHYTINAWADGYLSGQESFVVAAGETAHRMDVNVLKGETKWAPCDGCYPGPVYYEKGVASGTAVATAPAGAPNAAAARDAPTPTAATSSANAPTTPTGIQAYSGSGGGLPPYRAADAGAAPEGTTPTKAVPGPALGLVLLGLVGIALILRRR